jgi:hypothetical protein
MGKAEYKVPGGKLLYAETETKNGMLLNAKISGDFFMHPEESILQLEEKLEGQPIYNIDHVLRTFLKSNNITLFGVDPDDFVKVIRLSLDSK